MSKILVIPDTHLKPKIFDLADKIMHDYDVDYAVQLGDNFDDFYCFVDEYCDHYTRMTKFYQDHPETIWLWGNHELSYILNRPVTGNTYAGKEHAYLYRDNFHPKAVYLDGKVVFSHAGIFQEFIDDKNLGGCKTATGLVRKINQLKLIDLWGENSPVWARPQFDILTRADVLKGYQQVVGHTPMKAIDNSNGIISTDVFSTNWGRRYGEEKMIIIDTDTGVYEVADIDFRKKFLERK